MIITLSLHRSCKQQLFCWLLLSLAQTTRKRKAQQLLQPRRLYYSTVAKFKIKQCFCDVYFQISKNRQLVVAKF